MKKKNKLFVIAIINIILIVLISKEYLYSFNVDGNSKNGEEKTVYITSDDGPWSGTENIITTMIRKKAPITLFLIGDRYTKAKDHLKKVVDDAKQNQYIQIANHSYSHAWGRYGKFYHTDNLAKEDFIKNTKILGIKDEYPIYGRFPARNVFRLPGLKKNDDYVTKHCKNPKQEEDIYDKVYDNGKYYIYGWDVYWDFNSKGKPLLSPKQIVQRIEEKFTKNTTVLPSKCILIMHDVMFIDKFNGKENLSELIDLLREKGYKLDFIKNYLQANNK